MIKKDFVIIGGGVAGLCAANRLSELGASPLLIEGSHYPSHKVCGEFFSPHCLSILEKWNIFPLLLSKAYFRTLKHSIEFPFPSPAGALSHFTFDYQLVNRAQHLGAEILIHTKVERILYKENLYHVHLSSQESVVTPSLLVATGRIPHLYSSPSSFPYIGIKAHFKNLSIEKDRLEMFSLPGGYMGMCSIEEDKFNVACLAKAEHVKKFRTPAEFMNHFITQHPLLKNYFSHALPLFPDWMSVPIPEFGLKQTPSWPSAYFLGDAAGTIPPACGKGLAMAIESGCLAAEHAIKGHAEKFKQEWKEKYASTIRYGKWLHALLLRPAISNYAFPVGQVFPLLPRLIFDLTH